VCSRYYSLFDKQQVAEHFHARWTSDGFGPIVPNYNIAPDTFQPVIRRSRETGEREFVIMRWGIVPWFAKSELEFKKLSTINAEEGCRIERCGASLHEASVSNVLFPVGDSQTHNSQTPNVRLLLGKPDRLAAAPTGCATSPVTSKNVLVLSVEG
jgi:hypothetical protein